MGDLVVPKYPKQETMLKLSMQQDYRDAFHPYGPVLLNDLAKAVRENSVFPGRGPFRQAAKTAVKPSYKWRASRGDILFYTENMEIPPGAGLMPDSSLPSAATQKAHWRTINAFWTSLGKVLFTDQVAAESWWLLLACSWRLPTEFPDRWMERCTKALYKGSKCALCREREETLHHIHYECTVVRALWAHIHTDYRLPQSEEDLFNEFTQLATQTARKGWHTEMARFYHSIRRIYVFFRFHHAEPPPRQLDSMTRFVRAWSEGTREKNFSIPVHTSLPIPHDPG